MPDIKIDKFRFGVFSGGKRRSSLWVAVANGNDLYIGARVIMNRLKVSLHGSGICQVAFLNDYVQEVHDRGRDALKDRTIVRWKRPETPPTGALCVASIRFPTDFLQLDLPEQKTRKLFSRLRRHHLAGHSRLVSFIRMNGRKLSCTLALGLDGQGAAGPNTNRKVSRPILRSPPGEGGRLAALSCARDRHRMAEMLRSFSEAGALDAKRVEPDPAEPDAPET